MTTGNDDDDRDEDRRAILSRRSRFIALALSGLASAGTAGCYDGHGRGDDAGIEADAEPVPCLAPPLPEDAGVTTCLSVDAGPLPCLEPPYDAGPPPFDAGAEPADAGAVDAGVSDAGEPVPCLTIIRPAR